MSFRSVNRLSKAAAVLAASLVVVTGVAPTAYAAATSPQLPASASADHSQGNAGTSGVYDDKQPLSTADATGGGANGQCPGGPYCSTRIGLPSGNGNQTTGNHTGEPCAGCVGKADNKNPKGQLPNGSDNNAGYECDRNNGIGKTNPAHTGCIPALTGACVTGTSSGGVEWVLTNSNGFAVTATWTSGAQTGTVTVPAGGSVTFSTSGTSVNVSFPGTTFPTITKSVDCPAPTPTQTLAAVINVCSSGQQAPSEGSLLAVEGTAITSVNPLEPPRDVTADAHTVDATAPTGYHFAACAGAPQASLQQIAADTSATETVTVPSGGSALAIFYVEKDTATPTQTLAGVIRLCSTGLPVTGGTLSATGEGQTFTDQPNPFGPVGVPAGDYTMNATPPDGYELTTCNDLAPTHDEQVVVPAGQSGLGIFYVEPIGGTPGGGQSLAGVIYLCSSGDVVSGGSLSATGEGQTFTDQPNPFGPVGVAAGDYAMTATPPTGYHLVVCNGLGSTGTETVNVPESGAGVGQFYVAPDVTATQTLAGVIYLCSSGQQVSGGTLSATGQGQSFADQANPFGPVQVPAGDYAMTAAAPAGFHLVDCGGLGWTGTETVTVPAGGAGVGRFYVAADVTPTQTLAGVIVVCATGQMAGGGTLTAAGASQSFTGEANPFGPVDVAAGDYAVTATPPAGFHLVVCNGHGSTGAETVNVPAGGAGVATFFVAADTAAAGPDLAIVKTAAAAKVTPGDTLRYTLTVSNVGSGPATGAVTVTDAVPAGLEVTAVDGGSAWSCTTAQSFTCTYTGGSVGAGQTVGAITVTTKVLGSAPATLVNTGTVHTPGDVNPANDTSTVHTPVVKVLGEKIPQTTPQTATTPTTPGGSPRTPEVLPFTGSSVTQLVPAALAAVALGGVLLLAGRRRRRA